MRSASLRRHHRARVIARGLRLRDNCPFVSSQGGKWETPGCYAERPRNYYYRHLEPRDKPDFIRAKYGTRHEAMRRGMEGWE